MNSAIVKLVITRISPATVSVFCRGYCCLDHYYPPLIRITQKQNQAKYYTVSTQPGDFSFLKPLREQALH